MAKTFKYRTKISDNLLKLYLKPILDFIGLRLSSPKTHIGALNWVDCDKKVNHIPEPQYFRNTNKEKEPIYVFIRTFEEFIYYKKHKEDFEYFNPFVKYKNALLLLLSMTPVIYDRYCKKDIYDEELSQLIVNCDEPLINSDEIIKYVNIIQYPTKVVDGEKYYKYKIVIKNEDGDIVELVSKYNNKIIAIIGLMIQIIDFIDYGKFHEDYEIYEIMQNLLEKYTKERELNRKDMKSMVFDNDIEVFDLSEDIDILDKAATLDDIISDSEEENEINITETYKDSIQITPMESDDELDLEYF